MLEGICKNDSLQHSFLLRVHGGQKGSNAAKKRIAKIPLVNMWAVQEAFDFTCYKPFSSNELFKRDRLIIKASCKPSPVNSA